MRAVVRFRLARPHIQIVQGFEGRRHHGRSGFNLSGFISSFEGKILQMADEWGFYSLLDSVDEHTHICHHGGTGERTDTTDDG